MATLIVQRTLTDYGVWRAVFEEGDGMRQQFGCTSTRVWQSPSDPTSVLVLCEFPTLEQAHGFTDSPELKEAMQRGGASNPRREFWEDAPAPQ